MNEIAIISGKGGTGKSSISAAFASIAQKTVLADCDVDAANLYILFNPDHEEEQIFSGAKKAVIDYAVCNNCGLCAEYCRFDAIYYGAGAYKISEVSCDGCQLCTRVCPVKAVHMVESTGSRMFSGAFRHGQMVYGRLAPGEENSGKLVNLVRSKAKEISRKHNIETIIIDGPPGIGCPVISSITGVNTVVIVTEPTVSGLHDLQRAVDIALKFNMHPRVVINKYDLNVAMTARIETHCKSAGIEIAGKLPFDASVVDAMVNCKTIYEWAPDSQLSHEMIKIWNKIKNNKP
jgi:MinD superfamily P-loop ATPase